jgi:hypothetical protein
VRWDNLFDDLEGQLEQELNAEEVDLRAEEERLRLGRLSLRNRLTSLAGADARGGARGGAPGGAPGGAQLLQVVLLAGETITVRPTAFGRDWLAADLIAAAAPLAVPAGIQCVLPLAAIAGVILNSGQVEASLGAESESAARVVERIGLPFVLRDLCRRRRSLGLLTATGTLSGTIDRVGRDHIDLAVHAPGTLRRPRDVAHVRIVPLAHIHLVRLN